MLCDQAISKFCRFNLNGDLMFYSNILVLYQFMWYDLWSGVTVVNNIVKLVMLVISSVVCFIHGTVHHYAYGLEFVV